eukprot:1423108-Pyramimonas_sp.AAC.1
MVGPCPGRPVLEVIENTNINIRTLGALADAGVVRVTIEAQALPIRCPPSRAAHRGGALLTRGKREENRASATGDIANTCRSGCQREARS